MSTTGAVMATNAARMLIDARLDAIDRALLGRVSRAERLDVVGEVESRIDEMLRARCGPGADPSREDVLAVLARLDPPEAYLPEDDEPPSAFRPAEPRRERPFSVAPRAAISGGRVDRRAMASGVAGIIGLASVLLVPVVLLVAQAVGSSLLALAGWCLCTMIGGVAGVVAVVLAFVCHFRSAWCIAGLILGILSTLMSLGASLLLLVDLWQ